MASTGPDPVQRTAQISFKVREAIRKALPAPQEQFFTVMVPGKVVNFAEFSEGFDGEGNLTTPILPTSVELAQAILCDDMPVLGPVQLGPTGRSVARSYDAAISKLVPSGTTIGVDVPKGGLVKDSPEARHHDAMVWLTTRDAKHENKTRVEIYAEKQTAHTKAVEAKVKAFDDALKRAMDDPLNTSIASRRAAYDMWVAENSRTYRNSVQAAYMDWVVNGNKEEVEYWFSIVDRQSAMSRIEASKEAMRNAVVQDTDGAAEFNKVKLSPSNWAVIAQKKAQSSHDQTRTVEWYTWEVSRLKKMNSLLEAMMATAPKGSTATTSNANNIANTDAHLKDTMTKFLEARAAYRKAESSSARDPKPAKAERDTLYKAYTDAQKELQDEKDEKNKEDIKALNHFAQDAQHDMHKKLADQGMAPAWIKQNAEKIKEYTDAISVLLKGQEGPNNALIESVAKDAKIPEPMKDPATTKAPEPDYFTAISVEITSSSSQETSSSHATAASFGASGSWGFFGMGSISASASHSNAASEAHKAMNSSSLFLRGIKGYVTYLRELRRVREKRLLRWNFSAFLLAANVVLEFSTESSAIANFFKTSTTTASASVGFGPFQISSSASHTQTSASSNFKATASGCRITIKSPQIIGWISQMVPALPRLKTPTTSGAAPAANA
ncbi:hypothetical protein H0H92_015193 [Tricholoma furcatifolium]|nr:hypothetical protein H0H92_015193 [Tricholoma furcatifolium]